MTAVFKCPRCSHLSMVYFANCPRCHRGPLVRTEATSDLVDNANIVREGQRQVNRTAVWAALIVVVVLTAFELLVYAF